MADRDDDRAIGVRSSALSLGRRVPLVVTLCYAGTAGSLAVAAAQRGLAPVGWLLLGLAGVSMVREGWRLRRQQLSRALFGQHFSHQVWLGGLLLLALILGRMR